MWLTAVAVATEIWNDQCKVLCELGGDLAPLDVRLRVTVQKQERRTVAPDYDIDCRPACLDRLAPKTRKEVPVRA